MYSLFSKFNHVLIGTYTYFHVGSSELRLHIVSIFSILSSTTPCLSFIISNLLYLLINFGQNLLMALVCFNWTQFKYNMFLWCPLISHQKSSFKGILVVPTYCQKFKTFNMLFEYYHSCARLRWLWSWTFDYNGTVWYYKNISNLNWIKLELIKIINKFWSKFINRLRWFEIIKHGHE